MNDLISRKALIAEYDRVHIGPPGGARKLMEDAPAVDALALPCKVGDTIYEVDYEHGVVKHEVYEVCVVFKTTATDDKGIKWDDFYTMDDIDTAHKARTEAEVALAKMDGGNEDG